MKQSAKISLLLSAVAALAACNGGGDDPEYQETDADYVGKAVGNFAAEEWYPGGELGTTESTATNCYEDETPAVTRQGFTDLFNEGDRMASSPYSLETDPYKGWGPCASRRACEYCHSGGYSHGHSRSDFKPVRGNGYIVSVYYPDSPGSNDGTPIDQLTTFTMTQAESPFLPPLDPDKVSIAWKDVTGMPSGLEMKFPADGETFSLRYPEVAIPQDAFNVDPQPQNYAVRLITSCNFQGLGLIDALSNEDIEAQYRLEDSYGAELNPEFWDSSAKNLTDNAYAEDAFGVKFVKRFNYDLLEGCLENDVALWDELNVLRSDINHICSTEAWAAAMAKNPDVISAIKSKGADEDSRLHPYFNDGSDEGIAEAVNYLLSPSANLYDNKYHVFKPEMTDDQYHAFMVWHRGISVPRARNLNDSGVQKGKELFTSWGCTNCHKPSWTTGSDSYGRSKVLEGRNLPQYANQTIYPYSDFVQHKLDMKNDIHGSWCRTTPLWGRGLSRINSGAEDRLHDARARSEVEAIMWHCYSSDSQAYDSALKFYKASKEDRDAVVKFLQSI